MLLFSIGVSKKMLLSYHSSAIGSIMVNASMWCLPTKVRRSGVLDITIGMIKKFRHFNVQSH